MNRLSFTFQVSIAFFLIFSILVSIVMLIDFKMKDISQTARKIEKLRIPTSQNSARLQSGIHHSLAALRGWIILGDEKFKKERALAWKEEIVISLKEMNDLSLKWTNPKNITRLNKINQLIKQFETYQQSVEDADIHKAKQILTNFAIPTAEAIRAKLDLMVSNQKELLRIDFKKHQEAIDDLLRDSIILSIVGAIFILLLGLYILKTFKLWMKFTKEVSQKTAEGNFTEKIYMHGSSDMLELSTSLDSMRDKLHKMNQGLEDNIQVKTIELEESISTLKLTQKQMMASEEMASLGSLVAGVTHELSTPIGSSLMGVSQLISMHASLKNLYTEQKMTQSDFNNFLELSEQVNESIHINLQRIIEMLQSFKQVSADQSSNQNYTFSIREKIEQIVLSLHNRLKHTNIQLEIDCDKDYLITNNAGALSQIFTNLIINSLIHGFDKGQEGSISFKVFEKDNKTHIVYKDNGKGISQENLVKIFEPFFTTNKENGGTGLGMHIIKNLAEESLKGTITANSKKDEGVEFEIIF